MGPWWDWVRFPFSCCGGEKNVVNLAVDVAVDAVNLAVDVVNLAVDVAVHAVNIAVDVDVHVEDH